MIPLHKCKTKTHQECELLEIEDTQKIASVKQAVSSYQVEDAYRQLTMSATHVRYFQECDDFTISLKRNIFGLYMVPISLDSKMYWFIIDTGAQISSIRSHIISSLSVEKLNGKLSIGSIGGTQKVMNGYLLEKLTIGKLHIHNLPVIALDQKDFQIRFGGIDILNFDGILGWDILSQLDFEIDDVRKQFKVLKNVYRFSYQNMVKAMFPVFLVKDAKGQLLTMGFDSGAKMSWMNGKKANAYGYGTSDEITALGFGVHGMEELHIQMIPQMDFYLYKAHVMIKNIHTGRTNIFSNFDLDGILGNEIFRNRRIRIINSKSIVLLA